LSYSPTAKSLAKSAVKLNLH